MNLTNKFLITIFLITSVAVSIFTYLQISAQSEILENELQQRVLLLKSNLESKAKNTALSLKENIENDLSVFNFSNIDQTLNHLVRKQEVQAILLRDTAHLHEMYFGNHALKALIPHTQVLSPAITEAAEKRYFTVSTPITLHQQWGELHLVYSLDSLNEEVREAETLKKDKIASTIDKALFTGIFLATLFLVLGYLFTKHLTAPILLLTQTARKIAFGNLDVSDTLTPIKTKDEVGMLTDSFIEMSRRLSDSYHQMQVLNYNLEQKSEQLAELNESLEEKVAQKVAQLQEQEEVMIAQSRLAAMGEMMSMIAHQWRQPLSTASLMIANEKINAMIHAKESTQSLETLDKISDVILYLSHLIDDFQTYFKPEKSTETLSVNTLVERVQMLLFTRLEYEKVQLVVTIEKEISIETYVNELVQVIINIVNNAIDALIESQTPSRNIWLRIFDRSETLSIEIEDNASGIPDHLLEQIFEPYFSTKSKNGTGLGLYMAKMIIERHIGGELTVANTSNGACFQIILPKRLPLQNPDNGSMPSQKGA